MLSLIALAVTAATLPHADAAVSTKTIATDLHVPWGVAFLPSGDALVAERTTGKILRVPGNGGKPRLWRNVRGVAENAEEGGLLGLALSPRFKRNRRVYAYYTSADDNRVVSFKRKGAEKPIITGLKKSVVHNGGRIAFGPDGKLYATVGDAATTSNSQDRDSRNGKILRVNPNGSVPSDNPFSGSPVWSLGHRNPQGLAWDRDGRLWAAEFGQNEFDEVNLIEPGRNYGWPVVEGKGDTDGGRYTNPKVTWRTSEASPSGAAIRGRHLYVGALRGEGVYKIRLSGTNVGTPKLLYGGKYGRVRTVVKAPGGGLWITTSNTDGRGDPTRRDDRIIRVKG